MGKRKTTATAPFNRKRLRAKATQLGLPMAQLGLAWVLSRPGITATPIGARSPTQVDQAFEAAQLRDSLQAELDML